MTDQRIQTPRTIGMEADVYHARRANQGNPASEAPELSSAGTAFSESEGNDNEPSRILSRWGMCTMGLWICC
jgi:hypothetical protein